MNVPSFLVTYNFYPTPWGHIYHSCHSPMKNNLPINDGTAAVDWCRQFVDGEKIMPILPCHIRTHLEKWDRNQRIKESYKKSLSGRHKLEELNKILLPVAEVDEEQDSIMQDSQPPMPNNQQQNQPKQTNPTTTTPTSQSARVIHGQKPCIPQQSPVPQLPAPRSNVCPNFIPTSTSYARSKSITPCSLCKSC